MKNNVNRRNFLKTTTVAGLGLAFTPGSALGKSSYGSQNNVSIGFIGVGGRGRSHLGLISQRKDVVIPAICDIDSEAIAKTQKLLKDNGLEEAETYTDHEYAYRKLLEREDIDGVLIATPWVWHSPMAVDAMKAGKYVGLEVPAATTLEGCWDLVHAHEESGTQLMFLENVNYAREVLAVLQMLRDNLFGTPVHATCGYKHDLRGVKFEGAEFGKNTSGESRWRTQHSLKRNADLYPTHGVGPVAKWFNINRGNQFEYLTSVATKSAGLNEYIVSQGGSDHPNAKLDWELGDIVTTIIKTANGESIVISHDTNLPRPYSWGFTLHGTGGVWNGQYEGRRIYIEGKSKHHQWETGDDYDAWMKKYDHPLWKKYEKAAREAGHGGIDYFTDRTFVECVKQNAHPPMDVYDAAAWSSITPLSEKSVSLGSQPVNFPDFTGGRWIHREEPIFGRSKIF
ncbi:MAG: Gfo/Idh/MocA family oxidoreductase [Bacteroidales bacterium]|nr:Gfo/Idh/MocA family oxidoreductase [Bacteroidales bacterium]